VDLTALLENFGAMTNMPTTSRNFVWKSCRKWWQIF